VAGEDDIPSISQVGGIVVPPHGVISYLQTKNLFPPSVITLSRLHQCFAQPRPFNYDKIVRCILSLFLNLSRKGMT